MTGSIVFADHWSKEFHILGRILDNLENLTLTTQYQRVVMPRIMPMRQLWQSQLHLPDLISVYDVTQLSTDELENFYRTITICTKIKQLSWYPPEDSRQHQFIRILFLTLHTHDMIYSFPLQSPLPPQSSWTIQDISSHSDANYASTILPI